MPARSRRKRASGANEAKEGGEDGAEGGGGGGARRPGGRRRSASTDGVDGDGRRGSTAASEVHPLPRGSVAVLVLGDVGRSPRMQYHARSIAQQADVDLVGFGGEACVPEVENDARIRKRLLAHPTRLPFPCCCVRQTRSRALFLLTAPFKVLAQILQLFWVLMFVIPRPSSILVQNPPSIPSLLVAWVVARVRRARLIIDWHNFGYTILALRLGPDHPLVRVSRVYERWFARRADGHLCVTHAMKQWLKDNWGVSPTVLHDRAPEFFHPCSVEEAHDLFSRLKGDLPAPDPTSSESNEESTLFTSVRRGDSGPHLRTDRPALLMSCTSWTPDEDFGILLNALVALDARVRDDQEFPQLLVVVTGKGPQRAMYEAKFNELDLRKVSIRTMWLEAADYPLLLGCADLGVSLHTSSSGLDLPMKVVDMFGCHLPVCAVGFNCLDELVQHGENGFVFKDADELSQQLHDLFRRFPEDTDTLARLRRRVRQQQTVRWSDNWDRHAAPIVIARKP